MGSQLAQQRRREQKRKRREQIRKAHLNKARQATERESIEHFIKGGVVLARGVPERNDREGWQHFNALELSAILKKAMSMFAGDKLLIRFLSRVDDVSKFDFEEISMMLTKAAQAIECNPPFYIPYVRAIRVSHGTDIGRSAFRMEKIHTPYGATWTWCGFDKQPKCIYVGQRLYLYTMSTHAVERLYERVLKVLGNLLEVVGIMHYLEPKNAVMVNGEWLIPLVINWKGVMESLIGYVPFMYEKHMVMAKSFLLPTMEGTPERVMLNLKGHSDFNINSIQELLKNEEFLKKEGIMRSVLEFDDEREPSSPHPAVTTRSPDRSNTGQPQNSTATPICHPQLTR